MRLPDSLLVPTVLAQDALDDIVDDDLDGADWLRAAIIFAGAIVVAVVVSRIVRAVLNRSVATPFAAIMTGRIVAYLIFVLGLFYSLNSLGVRVGPLLGALGLGGLILALALQKVVENFVGALILQTRRPFTVGDTVRLDEHLGVVVDIDSRTTVLRGLDGSAIRVPNGTVITNSIVNLTREPLRRSELVVGVAYDTNLEKAAAAIDEAIERVRRVRDHPEPLVMLSQFGESSIDYTVYYWHASDVPSELAARNDLMLSIHQSFAAAGVTIAFPQMVVWSGDPAGVEVPYAADDHVGEVFSDQPTARSGPAGSPGAASPWWRRARGG